MIIKVTVEGYAKYDLTNYVPEGAVIKSYSIEHDDITIHYTLNGYGYQCCRSLNLLSSTEDHIHTQVQEISSDSALEDDHLVAEGWTKHSDGTHKRYNVTGIDLTKPKGHGRW